MINLEKFSTTIKEYFASKGVNISDALLIMKSDIGADSGYKNVYIVVDSEGISVAEGALIFERSGRRLNGTPIRSERFE